MFLKHLTTRSILGKPGKMIFSASKVKYSVDLPTKSQGKDSSFSLEDHFLAQTDGKDNKKDNKEFKFVPVAEQTFYCKDSRGAEANFGAPGGDFGEFLLACSELQRLEADVDFKALLREWIDQKCTAKRPFYLHTDEAALKRVFESINLPFKDVQRLDKREQVAFLAALQSGPSTFHGCGHLRLIREQEEGYAISKALMDQLLEGFFGLYWQQCPNVMFKVYDCGLDARALAIVHGPEEMKSSLLATQRLSNGQQCFILNQHAVSVFRKDHLAPFFAGKSGGQVEEKDFFKGLEQRGWENAMKTAGALAPNLPIYRIDLEKCKK